MSAFSFGRKNKYRATRTDDGFSSKLEKAVFIKLKDREVLGLIKDIKRQQTVELQGGGRDTRITWRVDFSFVNVANGALEYAEAKGVETNDYLIKLKLWRGNPKHALEIWKGHYTRPVLALRIEPTHQEGR